MGIWERLRPVRYWIGGGFCPIGDEELARRIAELQVHTAECERRFTEIEGHYREVLDQINADRLAMMQQITGTAPDDPNVWLMRRPG